MDTPESNLISICIVDYDSGVSEGEIIQAAHALTVQINQHFGLPPPAGWGIAGIVRAASPQQPLLPTEWQLGLFKDTDQPGALGFHDRTDNGTPFLHVFPALDQQDGVPWTVTASHEVLEALLDPELSLCFQDSTGTFLAGEVCDPVEQDQYSIGDPTKPGDDSAEVMVSNFVLPAWFAPASQSTKFDFLGLCKTAYEIRSGGYAQKFQAGAGWTQITNGQLRAYRQRMASQGRWIKRVRRIK